MDPFARIPSTQFFDALPGVAYVVDAQGQILVTNAEWSEFAPYSNAEQLADATAVTGITSEAYYREGGPNDVSMTHGICDTCWATIVLPLLEETHGARETTP